MNKSSSGGKASFALVVDLICHQEEKRNKEQEESKKKEIELQELAERTRRM